MGPETRFKIKVLKRLKQIPGVWFFKVDLRAVRGIPDIVGCKHGKFFALELKVDSSLTKLQLHTLKEIGECQGYAKECNPDNLKQILQELEAL